MREWIQATRAFSLTATLAPGLAVWIHGWREGWEFHPGLAISALLGAVLLQIACNVLNDLEDDRRGIDWLGSPGGAQVLQRGTLDRQQLRRLALGSLALGVVLGLPSVIAYPRLILPIAIAGGLGVIGYSSRPFGFKYRALGDVAVLLCVGPLLTWGCSITAFGRGDATISYLGMGFGLAAWGLLHANNLHDITIDRDHGARTLATQLGFAKSRWLLASIYALICLIWGAGALSGGLPWPVAFSSLLLLPVFSRIASRALRASSPESPLLDGIRMQAAQAHLLLGVLTCLTLFWRPVS